MKKSVRVYYICILVLLLALPIPAFALLKDHVDTENYENRTLASAPVLSLDTIGTFPSDFENYFSDHLPFRNQLIYVNSLLEYRVLKQSSSDSVIVGKEGWLFYQGAQVNDEDPIGDYQGTNLYSQEELQIIAENMQTAADTLAAEGREFVVMITPNKEGVYSEYMPDAYGNHTDYGRMMQVADYLRSNTTVPVVVAYEDIKAYKQEHSEQLYFKYDTHWNNLGAYLGAKALVSQLGHEMEDLSSLSISEGTVPVYDLAKLIHLENVLTDDPAPVIEGFDRHGLQVENNGGVEFRGKADADGTTDGRKLFIIGDSFSTLMFQYVAKNFENSYLNFYYNYNYEMLENEDPQVVVYETVERYLNNMLHFSITDGISAEAEQ